ncbi:hybrid sensor histidine kinase/response regulator [bacterium]|nr:hybrid sensor histidine kinase/response regulator [bacterium]
MAGALLAAALPLLWLVTKPGDSLGEGSAPVLEFELRVLALFNVIAWSVVLLMMMRRRLADQRLRRFILRSGILPRPAARGDLLSLLLRDLSRRERALSMPHLEKRIHSREELAGALEEVVSAAYELLEAESAELALYDQESGMYHAAFIKGRPFQISAQAMLSGAVKGEEQESRPDVLIHPITFAGNILGTLRIGLAAGRYPDASDRKVVTMLAAQAALALTNAQYTEQLLRLKSASDESLRAKTGFLANLSHELRAPLGIILNGTEVLLDGLCGSINGEQEETLQMLKGNGEHLLELVNDVLDYAKIESGKMQPRSEDLHVQELLTELTAVVRKAGEEKGHKITLRPQTESLAISCDRRHFRQIILNLLTNAIKYTPEEGDIELWCERAPGNRVAVHVEDNGIGIAPQNHAKVFEAFERVDHSYALSQGGTGLGMSLTKRLAEKNGGRIDFTSALDKGSHFWVSFPAIANASISKQESIEEDELPDGKESAVLLLSAEQGDGLVLKRYLQSRNFIVHHVRDEEEAIECFSSSSIELFLFESSYQREQMGELIQQFQRSQRKNSKLPVMLLTSRAFAFDVEEFLRQGVDRCLIKPVKLVEVARIAAALIEKKPLPEFSEDHSQETTVSTSEQQGEKKKSLSIGASRVIGVDDLLH